MISPLFGGVRSKQVITGGVTGRMDSQSVRVVMTYALIRLDSLISGGSGLAIG